MNNEIAVLPPRNHAASSLAALVPSNITEAMSLAQIMAKAKLIPEHLRDNPGDCLLVVMQAQRWGMDVVSVAQCTSVVKGKMCYEGKLVAAVLYAMGTIEGRLSYKYSGTGQAREITVSGRVRGTGEDVSITGSVASWATDNGNWKKSPDDMLAYRGTRQWARRYAPEALLGIYTPDELEEATLVNDVPDESETVAGWKKQMADAESIQALKAIGAKLSTASMTPASKAECRVAYTERSDALNPKQLPKPELAPQPEATNEEQSA